MSARGDWAVCLVRFSIPIDFYRWQDLATCTWRRIRWSPPCKCKPAYRNQCNPSIHTSRPLLHSKSSSSLGYLFICKCHLKPSNLKISHLSCLPQRYLKSWFAITTIITCSNTRTHPRRYWFIAKGHESTKQKQPENRKIYFGWNSCHPNRSLLLIQPRDVDV